MKYNNLTETTRKEVELSIYENLSVLSAEELCDLFERVLQEEVCIYDDRHDAWLVGTKE